MTNQSNSNFWGTGTDLAQIRDILDPVEAKLLIENLGRRMFGLSFDYSLVEFRGLNLPITLIDNSNGLTFLVTPYWHLMTEDGRGNRI